VQRILLTILCLMALGLAACGGDEVSKSTDVNKLLTDTFTGKKDIKSGKFELAVKVDVKGAQQFSGPINLTLKGPFESQGDAKMPKFDIDAAFDGAGQSLKAGVMTTGEKGYVNFNGTEYAVSDEIFKQFKTSFENAAKQNGGQNQSLSSLGINPRNWLTNAKNAGEEKVGDTDTIKITGDVDVNKLLDDVNTALQKAGSLGLQGQAQLPTKLTDEQKQTVAKAVKGLKVDIYTGKEDTTLRRLKIVFSLSDPTGKEAGSAAVDFDLKLLDLNEGQEFKEPENAKPFDQLLQSLGGLGLGGLGGMGGGSGGSGGSGSSGSSGDSSKNLEEYTKCIEDAGNDLQKAQKCAEILTK
jgi:uncharacterized membrane protein YgcG